MKLSFPKLLSSLLFILAFIVSTNTSIAKEAKDIPLISATLDDNFEDVQKLLQAGENPNMFDKHRNTALIYAARDGHHEIAKELLKYGADAGWIDGELVTPLILASFKNHLEIVKLLLKHMPDCHHLDQWGRTAFDYALRRGRNDPIYLLLASNEACRTPV